MLKFLARLIGPKRAEFEAHRETARGSATSEVLRRARSGAPGAVPPQKFQAANDAPVPPKKPAAANTAPAPGKPPEAPSAPPETGFDPYNTGAFDRGASWERVGKRKL